LRRADHSSKESYRLSKKEDYESEEDSRIPTKGCRAIDEGMNHHSTIAPHLSLHPEVCDSLEQAGQYHFSSLLLSWGFVSAPTRIACYRVREFFIHCVNLQTVT
jgi:hypothetical protein